MLDGARIGRDCNICDRCFIENDVVLGDRVTVKCGVSLYDGLVLEDGVFVGPDVSFSNDPRPRSGVHLDTLSPHPVRRGRRLGAGAILLPGVTIGRFAMVGAGSLVTRDVPDFALVYGSPAQVHGHVCRCGEHDPVPQRRHRLRLRPPLHARPHGAVVRPHDRERRRPRAPRCVRRPGRDYRGKRAAIDAAVARVLERGGSSSARRSRLRGRVRADHRRRPRRRLRQRDRGDRADAPGRRREPPATRSSCPPTPAPRRSPAFGRPARSRSSRTSTPRPSRSTPPAPSASPAPRRSSCFPSTSTAGVADMEGLGALARAAGSRSSRTAPRATARD